MMKRLSTLFLLLSTLAVAQNDLLDQLDADLDMGPLYSESAFKWLKIINLESTKMVDKGEMYFIVLTDLAALKMALTTSLDSIVRPTNSS